MLSLDFETFYPVPFSQPDHTGPIHCIQSNQGMRRLDDLDWVEVAAYIAATENTVIDLGIYVYAKKAGEAAGPVAETTIEIARLAANTSNNKTVQTLARGIKSAVDSSNQFEVRWTQTGTATKDIDLYLTGYGWN